MPASPSVLKAIRAVRRALESSPQNDREANALYFAINDPFRRSERIVAEMDTLREVLALAPEVEGFRGKRSQMAAREFAQQTTWLVYRANERLPQSTESPELFPLEDEAGSDAGDVLECLAMLADHAFQRVRGTPVRSRHVASLRATAWEGLALIAEVRRRPEHLEHALKVAADAKASNEEREAAVEFLVAYWGANEPDEATATVLSDLQARPGNRSLLVAVMQAQIDLGLGDDFGALIAVEDWDENEAMD